MYGPKWPFLLMYGSQDMRHTGIPQVDRLSTGPRGLGRHTLDYVERRLMEDDHRPKYGPCKWTKPEKQEDD